MRTLLLTLLTLSALPVMAKKVIHADVLVTDIAPLENSHWQRQHQHSPKYPLAMAKAAVQGCAVVTFTIDKAGKPEDIEVVSAISAAAVSRSTARLVKDLRYVATSDNAQPQQRTIRIDYCIEDGGSQQSVEQQCQQRLQFACG